MGSPAQLGRQHQVALPVGGVAPVGQAAAVDAFVTASLFERQIRRLLPRLAGLLDPLHRHGGAGFLRAAMLRRLWVVPLEPLLGAPLNPVVDALREHQVRVRVVLLVGGLRLALVDGERIGQPLGLGKLRGKTPGELAPLTGVQFARQRELNLTIQPPVGAFVLVRRRPVGARVVLRPRGHVPMRHMLAFVRVLGVAALALDVLVLGAGRLPTATRAYIHL